MNGKNRAKVTFPLTIQSYGDIFCQVTDFVEKTSLSVFVQNLQISDTVMQCYTPCPSERHQTLNSELQIKIQTQITLLLILLFL